MTVRKMTSREQGQPVTIICSINAAGNIYHFSLYLQEKNVENVLMSATPPQ